MDALQTVPYDIHELSPVSPPSLVTPSPAPHTGIHDKATPEPPCRREGLSEKFDEVQGKLPSKEMPEEPHEVAAVSAPAHAAPAEGDRQVHEELETPLSMEAEAAEEEKFPPTQRSPPDYPCSPKGALPEDIPAEEEKEGSFEQELDAEMEKESRTPVLGRIEQFAQKNENHPPGRRGRPPKRGHGKRHPRAKAKAKAMASRKPKGKAKASPNPNGKAKASPKPTAVVKAKAKAVMLEEDGGMENGENVASSSSKGKESSGNGTRRPKKVEPVPRQDQNAELGQDKGRKRKKPADGLGGGAGVQPPKPCENGGAVGGRRRRRANVALPAPPPAEIYKPPRTFARREPPKKDPALSRWTIIRDVFNESVRPAAVWCGHIWPGKLEEPEKNILINI